MQDPLGLFQVAEKIVQLCKNESGALYLVIVAFLVVANFLPLGSWAKKVLSRQDSGSRVSDGQMNQYVFPHSENPTIIHNLNVMLPPEQEIEEENDE